MGVSLPTSLTRRATLTAASQVLDLTAKMTVSLLFTPVILAGLGGDLFGTWGMIQQSLGYLSLSDLKPMGTLKLRLSLRQHINDAGEKRRQVGAAVIVWLATLPVFFCAGYAIVEFVPSFLEKGHSSLADLKATLFLMVVCVAIERILSLPANALRGENLEFRAMGLSAAITLLGGALGGFVVWQGLGLVGLASTVFSTMIASSVSRFFIAGRTLSWFGVAKPSRTEFLGFARLTGWVTASSLGSVLLNGSDLLIVGLALGPESAATYGLTGTAVRMFLDPLSSMLRATNAGVLGICGEGDWAKAGRLRHEARIFGVAMGSTAAPGILLLNGTFVRLWVGEAFYAGTTLTLLFVLLSTVKLLFGIDNAYVTAALRVRRVACFLLLGGVANVAIGSLLVQYLGLEGMAAATIAAYLLQLYAYDRVLSALPGFERKDEENRVIRSLIWAAVPLVLAFVGSRHLEVTGWVELVCMSIVCGGIGAAYASIFVLNDVERTLARKRIVAALHRS